MKLTAINIGRRVAPGKYIVAVSGGIDSVVLLSVLVQLEGRELVVAHFDHGMRPDSAEDERFVAGLAAQKGLAFVSSAGKLGDVSENTARQARYGFLRDAMTQYRAQAIITAHHQDDVLETIVFNLQRGTGSKGLSSLRSSETLLRPLLEYRKQDLLDYAQRNYLIWREDQTNASPKYARNRVRHQILTKFSEAEKTSLLQLSKTASKLNAKISHLVKDYLTTQPSEITLHREQYRALPESVAREVLAQWLRSQTEVEISRAMIVRLDEAIRQGQNNSLADVARGWSLHIQRDQILLQRNRDL